MGDNQKPQDRRPVEDIIAAFDREREEAKELNRRHSQTVRESRAHDRPVRTDRRRPNTPRNRQ